MMTFPKLAVLGLILVLGACSRSALDDTGTNNVALGGATGALGSPSDPTSIAHFQQVVGDRVFFLVDQSTLSSEAQTTLAAQANWLMANADYNAVIEGHADEQGTREYNVALGARRANAVREFLISRGVPGGRIETVSYGKERPVAVCSDESCYSQNRRGVTVLRAGLSG